MKVLLFTHEQDIDGMGSIIIGKQAFEEFDYITCKTFEVNEKVNKTIENNSIYKYDFIFVTDICIKEPLLGEIAHDHKLKDKIVILDHHKSEIEEGNAQYLFVNITVSDEKGKTCGTSLFYQYLIEKSLLKPTEWLSEFAELTRQYDTWEWKNIYHNEKAKMLHILFEQLGYQKYINVINEMAENDKQFCFRESHLKIINNFEKQTMKTMHAILAGMVIYPLELNDAIYKIGFVKSPYEYRNDLSEVIIEDNKNDIDLIGMIIEDTDTVSYRKVKDVDVSKIAIYFGGKGHHNAASNPKNNKQFQKVYTKLF